MSECLICWDEITTNVISNCNHTNLCLSCFLMQRIVYNQTACPICRVNNEIVYLSSSNQSYESLKSMDQTKFYFLNNYGIRTLDRQLYIYIKKLITPYCKKCRQAFKSIDELNAHHMNVHHKQMCSLCMKNEKVFVNEHTLYTDKELIDHCKEIDSNTGKQIHPLCQFCNEMFMDEDKLEYHMNTCHERCYICCKHGHLDHYFKDYESLLLHFKKSHHVCNHSECRNKYMAFETAEELQYHTISTHTKKGQKFTLPTSSSNLQNQSYRWREEDNRAANIIQPTIQSNPPKLQKKDFPKLKSTHQQSIQIIQQQAPQSKKSNGTSKKKVQGSKRGTKIFL